MKSTFRWFTLCVSLAFAAQAMAADPPIVMSHDDEHGLLHVAIDGREAATYCYGQALDLPHYYPLRSPSGRSMTEEYPPHQKGPGDEPHHRSVWFADTVKLNAGRTVSFYGALYSRVDPKNPKSPLRDRVRQVKFLSENVGEKEASFAAQLIWEADLGKTPMADEHRTFRIVPLGHGEYLLDLKFTLTAAYGDLTFASDWIHYAWPYVRMAPEFSVKLGGGRIANSEGGVNEKECHNKKARWVDYSAVVGGHSEGLAVFAASPDNLAPRWLVRDYGTFGLRRPDAQSGTHFTLKKGDSLTSHVAILVHSGDAAAGHVQERYQQFIDGKL
jgi:hypothetical protein